MFECKWCRATIREWQTFIEPDGRRVRRWVPKEKTSRKGPEPSICRECRNFDARDRRKKARAAAGLPVDDGMRTCPCGAVHRPAEVFNLKHVIYRCPPCAEAHRAAEAAKAAARLRTCSVCQDEFIPGRGGWNRKVWRCEPCEMDRLTDEEDRLDALKRAAS